MPLRYSIRWTFYYIAGNFKMPWRLKLQKHLKHGELPSVSVTFAILHLGFLDIMALSKTHKLELKIKIKNLLHCRRLHNAMASKSQNHGRATYCFCCICQIALRIFRHHGIIKDSQAQTQIKTPVTHSLFDGRTVTR